MISRPGGETMMNDKKCRALTSMKLGNSATLDRKAVCSLSEFRICI